MIKKILIANRGEIVNRIINTCEKMNIETVVVYSDADKNANYIKRATESYCIGASAPVKSYLNSQAIIDVIKQSGADAVHPGYGFLSESANFAKAVTEAGATWIGPNPDILENIESKCYCRIIADNLGIPVTPGTIKPISGIQEIYETAHKVGMPVLLKLDKGGGGKGIEKIEVLESEKVTQAIFESMQRIGQMAFASGDIYVEKAIINPRHIEVQFMADNHGNVICLGERECSIQRRYQKIIEESPSVAVSELDRKKLYLYTKKLVKEMKYSGAGTIEYLRNSNGEFYFMEINARLQVEHPVSEMVTGVDLIEQQILVASNEKIKYEQEEININGHSIECRIYAENPKTFQPSPGVITGINFPEGDHIRIEQAIEQGHKVSPFYDPMLCKLVVWGENRTKCIAKTIEALKEFKVEGVMTNISTDIAIMRNKHFGEGDFNTSFLANEKVNIGLENYVVTISREFGSLGRPIAKLIAEKLGIEYYDRTVIDEVAKQMKLPLSEIDDGEELENAELAHMEYPLGMNSEETQEEIFAAQEKIIKELSSKDSCVIVGRCSDYVLRDSANHFSVFIYAPYEVRRENCIKTLNISKDEVDKMIESVDNARKSYNMHYAKTFSEDVRNKDILIDSSMFDDIEDIADIVVQMIRKKFKLA